MSRRLFLFAAYTESGDVGDALLHYLRSLSALGDIVFCDDAPLKPGEEARLGQYVLHCEAFRHGEYDFGSYKRDFIWAREHLALDSYDYLYLVNDSVFGPLFELKPLLEKLETGPDGAFGLVYKPGGHDPHLQSWFVGLGRAVFLSGYFAEFLLGVGPAKDKGDVCRLYESGLSRLLLSHGTGLGYAFAAPHKDIYNRPLRLVRKGLPFVKKSAFTRHNGSLGREIGRILKAASHEAADAIISEASQLWGKDFVDRLIDMSRIGSALRYLGYLRGKLLKN